LAILKNYRRGGLVAMCLAVAVVTAFSARLCHATPLVAGSAVVAAAEPYPTVGANLKFSTGKVGFLAASYSGFLTSTVYDNDATNPFGPNGLTFTYLLENAATSIHELHRFTVSSFSGFGTDVSYVAKDGTTPPTFVDRSPVIGDVVGFNYPTSVPPVFVTSGPLAPGSTSSLMVIQTNALNWVPTFASVIDGSTTMVLSLAPGPLVPEPSSIVLAAMSTAALYAVGRRRRSARGRSA